MLVSIGCLASSCIGFCRKRRCSMGHRLDINQLNAKHKYIHTAYITISRPPRRVLGYFRKSAIDGTRPMGSRRMRQNKKSCSSGLLRDFYILHQHMTPKHMGMIYRHCQSLVKTAENPFRQFHRAFGDEAEYSESDQRLRSFCAFSW